MKSVGMRCGGSAFIVKLKDIGEMKLIICETITSFNKSVALQRLPKLFTLHSSLFVTPRFREFLYG